MKRVPLTALAATVGAAGLSAALILAVTPLSGLPDTVCGRLVLPSGTQLCGSTIRDRALTSALLLAVSVGLLVFAWVKRRAVSVMALAAGAVAVLASSLGVWALARGGDDGGLDYGACGSVLSPVDPNGSYSDTKPEYCRPFFDERRDNARVAFVVSLVALVGVAASGRPRTASTSPTPIPRSAHSTQ